MKRMRAITDCGASFKETNMQDGPNNLPAAAKRALAEAEERRQKAATAAAAKDLPEELGGRNGPEPVRFGDWEKNGIAVDF